MVKITFFGDGWLTAMEPLMYFPNRHVACDYSECGLYVASKHYERGEKVVFTNLQHLARLLLTIYGDVELEAYNNGIATFFARNGIKTLRQLCEYFTRELDCPYP
jgi:hypothetical protein